MTFIVWKAICEPQLRIIPAVPGCPDSGGEPATGVSASVYRKRINIDSGIIS